MLGAVNVTNEEIMSTNTRSQEMSSVSLDMKAMVAEDSSDSDQTDTEVAESKVR